MVLWTAWRSCRRCRHWPEPGRCDFGHRAFPGRCGDRVLAPCGGHAGAVATDSTPGQCRAPGHGLARWSGLQDKMHTIRRVVRRFATLWRYVHSLRVHHRLRGPGSLALAQAIRHDRLTRTRVHCRACTRSPCRCARGAKNEPAAPVGLLGPAQDRSAARDGNLLL